MAWKKDSAKKMASLADPRLPAKRRSKLTQKAVQRWQAQLDILGQAVAHKLERMLIGSVYIWYIDNRNEKQQENKYASKRIWDNG